MKFALINGIILDGTENMSEQKDMTVLVEEDKITAIQSKTEKIPKGFRKIDLKGKYILPGLINMHCHMPGSGKPTSSSAATNIADLCKRFKIVRNIAKKRVINAAKTEVNSGVTTLRSMGEVDYTDLEVRDMINKGKLEGPRMLVSGTGVSVPDGHAAGLFAYPAETVEDVERIIEENVKRGVDLIKIFVTGGVFDATAPGEPGVLRMSQELATACCEIAHKHGLKVASHTESTPGVLVDLKAGVDTVEHGAPMTDEIIELFKQTGASVPMTISPAIPIALITPMQPKMDEIKQLNSNVVYKGIVECAKQALANGIPVGLGTDTACPYVTHYDMWRELVYFVKDVGVTNNFALHTATQINARLLGIGDITGTLEVGKCADIIAVDSNPLEDISVLRNVRMVMTRGRLIKKPKVKHLKFVDKELDSLLS